MRYRGLSLIEVLVVVCLIGVLAVISLPMMSSANGQARSAACQANLATLGQHLETFENSHGRLPVLMNRDCASLRVPTLDELFQSPRYDPAVFHCPADDRAHFERSGTSYRWYTAWDAQPLTPTDAPRPPLLADKAPFHTDQPHPYNALFADHTDPSVTRYRLTASPYTLDH